MSSKEAVIKRVNQHSPQFISMLGGQLVDFDADKIACTFTFDISKDFCHSIDVVQGGFVTAMLDAAMSHAVFMFDQEVVNISSLEIKTSYLAPTRAGKLRVEGWAVKKSYKIVFMEGRVYDENNELTATASSVAKIARAPKK